MSTVESKLGIRRSPFAGAACLAAMILLCGAGVAAAHPNDACMPVTAYGQQGDDGLEVVLGVEKTPQIRKIEDGRNDEKRFFIRWAWAILDADGNEVTTLTQEVELVPPFTTVLLPHCEVPGNGNGSGGADEVEHIEVVLQNVWDGTDAAGNPVPDGDYDYAIFGELVWVIETGNPDDDHVNVHVIGELGPELGVFTLVTLQVTAQATPESGPVPLPVLFSALVEGEAALYEWDFDGDGTYDFASPTSPSTIYTYSEVGVFDATLRATGASGKTVLSTVTITATPGLTANVIANPTSGTRPLTVRFTPEAQSTGPSITGYRWDFNGDGIYDTGFDPRPSTRTYTYTQKGVFDARLQVRDASGRTAEDVEPITVANPRPTVEVEVVPSNGPAPLDVTFVVTASSAYGAITVTPCRTSRVRGRTSRYTGRQSAGPDWPRTLIGEPARCQQIRHLPIRDGELEANQLGERDAFRACLALQRPVQASGHHDGQSAGGRAGLLLETGSVPQPQLGVSGLEPSVELRLENLLPSAPPLAQLRQLTVPAEEASGEGWRIHPFFQQPGGMTVDLSFPRVELGFFQCHEEPPGFQIRRRSTSCSTSR